GFATAPTFTANLIVGADTVIASAPGFSATASFNLTNSPDVPNSITATTSTAQSLTVATVLSNALDVVVKDSHGNLISGATVTFTITAGGTGATGTFAGNTTTATATTGSNGIAIAPAITTDAISGTYTVTASVSGVSGTVPFTITNKPDVAASL